MSKFKLYYGGQLFKMNGLVIKGLPPEQDVLSYTYDNGIYTMSISNPSRTTLRLLDRGNLVLAASVRDIKNTGNWFTSKQETIIDENGEEIEHLSVRQRYHPRYSIPFGRDNMSFYNRAFIDDVSYFTFDERAIIPPRGIGDLLSLSNGAGRDDPIESITTKYKFVLLDQNTGRVYKSYRKTDGYHPLTFYYSERKK